MHLKFIRDDDANAEDYQPLLLGIHQIIPETFTIDLKQNFNSSPALHIRLESVILNVKKLTEFIFKPEMSLGKHSDEAIVGHNGFIWHHHSTSQNLKSSFLQQSVGGKVLSSDIVVL